VNLGLTSEEEMIARICGGEKTLFHDLIRPYTRIMFGYADAVLRNSADSKEAVQEAALKVFLNLSKLEDRARFRAWLAADCDQRGPNVSPSAETAALRPS